MTFPFPLGRIGLLSSGAEYCSISSLGYLIRMQAFEMFVCSDCEQDAYYLCHYCRKCPRCCDCSADTNPHDTHAGD